uniref:Uncharacterized protein n=1 Tax=Sphenodon punctatus TaxID=8508 RepID=A0A8D0GGC0_SPHPU
MGSVLCRFAQLAAVDLLRRETGDGSDDELDTKDVRFFERHGVEGSTDSKDDVHREEGDKRDARGEFCLSPLFCGGLVIAVSNFKQLGGITNEDKTKKKEDRQLERTVQELQVQLDYERIRREKLEGQLDAYRAETGRLKECLEKLQITATPLSEVSVSSCSWTVWEKIGKNI